jgi:hypothetical protein
VLCKQIYGCLNSVLGACAVGGLSGCSYGRHRAMHVVGCCCNRRTTASECVVPHVERGGARWTPLPIGRTQREKDTR